MYICRNTDSRSTGAELAWTVRRDSISHVKHNMYLLKSMPSTLMVKYKSRYWTQQNGEYQYHSMYSMCCT